MHNVDNLETVKVAGLELARVEYQAPAENDRHDNVWTLLHRRPLSAGERAELDAWAERTGAALLG